MERDEAWKRIFEKLPVVESLARDGIFYVTSDELKSLGGREPRLMAKIDTLAERPAVLAEHGVSLFPVRNGRYALFPDPAQKSFYRFAEELDAPVRAFQSAVDLTLFDTFPRDLQASESQALDFAFISSLLISFCGDEGMRLTLRGRFFSGDFCFRTPQGLGLDVSRVQIEVDAGYEGKRGIHLIEAKRGRRDDFHIRQLWYPYLHWAARTRKAVAPIFFAYSNGQYFLTEFAFGEEFGDLSVVRHRAYCLEESPQADVDFHKLMEETPVLPEPEGSFPQANDLDKVIDLVQIAGNVHVTKAQIAETFDFDERQGDYYANAGCYLGLLVRKDGGFEAGDRGRAFIALRARTERTIGMVRAMLQIPSLRACVRLLVHRDYRVEKIAAGELAEIIRENTGPAAGASASTALRRASTVKAWLVWIMRNVRVRVR